MLKRPGTHAVGVKEALQGSVIRALMIGIVGVIVRRTLMILVGAWLIHEFHWVLRVFGVFLIVTGIRMWWAAGRDPDLDLESNPALGLRRCLMPVSQGFHGERFCAREFGWRIATPPPLAIALVGITDVIFAVDSIPAILAITTDPFIVLTSNVVAILAAMTVLMAPTMPRIAAREDARTSRGWGGPAPTRRRRHVIASPGRPGADGGRPDPVPPCRPP